MVTCPRLLLSVALAILALLHVPLGDARSEDRVSYARDIAPLLAQHCLECHGPDAAQREAGLRLDVRASAVARLESGKIAVVPGAPDRSELIRRVTSGGDDRMPPSDAGEPLTARQVRILSDWIRQEAPWQSHWAFSPPKANPLPLVKRADWCRSPLDRFILADLERKGLQPLAEAERSTLLRRVYFDLLGLPPTPRDVAAFLADERPDAWEQVVDRLLASPLYGQRWGRHWLDVARYGDSNGGDENHAYPLAWRYRDYVIDAFNADLPYDAFVREQIAGDLLPDEQDHRRGARVTATGFLALGAKILAERDKVKMRADLVDEQIDTLGKSFLALTLGCARCHDHKFDPIPATDYYALAGILHSTQLGDRAIASAAYANEKAAYDRRLAALQQEKKKLQRRLEDARSGVIEREAEKFDRGNAQIITSGYGEGIGVISDPGSQQNFAEFDIKLEKGGDFLLQLRYAAQNARPGRILLNGKVVREKAIREATGGWYPQHQKWHAEGVHVFDAGDNVLRLESAPLMSHIDRLRLIRYERGGKLSQTLDKLDELDKRFAALAKTTPQPVRVMGVSDGEAMNVRVHLRGSHLSLGDEVPRSFPGIVSARAASLQASDSFAIESGSGRLPLAPRWMTDPGRGAGGQAARVIVNRVWLWHFGRGLVATPNNFGLQGKRPTHPELLDWLALRLIEDGWSLKSLHRRIVTSKTYRQASGDRGVDYSGWRPRRLEAEVIRDSMLFHAGRLDDSLGGGPLMVKSQDPSPADLRKNEQYYRDSRRRSAYLPVVRSNVYRFLTLFDFPNAATPVGRRDTTTAPTQALLLMNDPFVMRQAEQLARRLLAVSPDLAAADPGASPTGEALENRRRLVELYQRLFSRSPLEEESQAALGFLEAYAGTVEEGDRRARRLAVWTGLCHALMASNEFIHVD